MNDVTFIIPMQNKNWILDRIAHEIGNRIEGKVEYHYQYHSVPLAHKYWIAHYTIIPSIMSLSKHVKIDKCVAFYTHTSYDLNLFVPYLKQCGAVVCENDKHYKELADAGVDEKKLSYIVECSSPEMFKPHTRSGKGVLISSYYRERKCFDTVLEVAKMMPHRTFTIVTKDLHKFKHETELRHTKNIKLYEDIVYKDYPAIYADCDVYLSCASLEGGGPNSLIEAMHANLVPVASDTGNSRDYIQNGFNGYVYPLDSSVETICGLIEKAYKIEADVSASVSSFTWTEYAKQWAEILKPGQIFDETGKIRVEEANVTYSGA